MKVQDLSKNIFIEIEKMLSENPANTIVESVLYGNVGEVFYIYNESLISAMVKIGDFIVVEGEINKQAEEYLEHMQTHGEVISSNSKWYDFILENWGEGCINKRVIFNSDYINKSNLKEIIVAMPEGCRIEKIDGIMAKGLLKHRWSRELISNFNSVEEFLDKGIGFVVVNGLKIVSGASSFSILRDGVEVEVDTNTEYRKNGYGTLAGAALVLYCLENNLKPHWDAMNPIACKIAEKLGYKAQREYKTLLLD